MTKQKVGYIILSAIALIGIAVLLFVEPKIQKDNYHNFSDEATIFGIPNFWNVVSNLPFLLVGMYGLLNLKFITFNKHIYATFFVAIILVGFGSAHYHWQPTNHTLVWDRLPMTIAFTSLFCIVIGEFICKHLSVKIFIPFVAFGVFSIFYWYFTNFTDLRLYAFVQFYPILAMPVILLLFEPKFAKTDAYWWLFLSYFIAKIFEHFDVETQNIFSIISGHSLKHLVAAIGLFILVISYKKRALILVQENK